MVGRCVGGVALAQAGQGQGSTDSLISAIKAILRQVGICRNRSTCKRSMSGCVSGHNVLILPPSSVANPAAIGCKDAHIVQRKAPFVKSGAATVV